MTKVFIVVERKTYDAYRGSDTIMRVFANYKDAVAYADELTAQQNGFDYDVLEREVY